MKKTIASAAIFLQIVSFGCDKPRASQPNASSELALNPVVQQKIQITGATGLAPAIRPWCETYTNNNAAKVEFQLLGSRAGFLDLMSRNADIALVDLPITHLNTKSNAKSSLEITHVPIAINSVVVVCNLEGITVPIRFTGSLLADIFLGKVKKWNDRAIQDLNRDVALPDLAISVIYRKDTSSTTRTFSKYLSNHSKAFRDSVGHGTIVKWPVRRPVIFAEGLSSMLKSTQGSIACCEYPYALIEKLGVGAIQNNDSVFVDPNTKSMTAASEALKSIQSDDFYLDIIDAPGKSSYPICSLYAAIIPNDRLKKHADPAVAFLKWVIGPGQESLAESGWPL